MRHIVMRLVTLVCAAPLFLVATTTNAQVVTENFDSNPGWSQYGQPSGVIDFGYSGSSNAGGDAGEAGGFLARFDADGGPAAGSYGVPLGRAFTLAEPMMFSAKIYDSGDTEPQFGFYTEGSMVSSWAPPRSFLGYAPDVNGTAYLKIYSPGGNVAKKPNLTNTGAFELTVSYDPNIGDHGQLSANINGSDTSIDISEAVRNSGVEFTHFGLNVLSDSHASGFRRGEFYFDDVTYTSAGGVTAEIASRFAWTASGLGDWGSSSNWTSQGGVAIGDRANSPNHTAVFSDSIVEPTNVSTMATVTLNRIEFNNEVASFVVSGLGSVNMASTTAPTPVTPTISVAGSHKFQAAVNLINDTTVDVTSGSELVFDGALDLAGATLTKTGAGEMAIRNDLVTGAGAVSIQQGTVSGSGTVNGDLINDGGSVSPGDSMASAGQAVPEPASCFLFGMGLLTALQFWRRRRL